MSTVELLFSDRRHPGTSQPRTWTNSEVALYLPGDGPRYPFIDTQVARCGLDRYLAVQVWSQAKIQLAGEPATRLNTVFRAPAQVVVNGCVKLALQTIDIGGLERNYRIWGRIPTESSYSTLAMYPLYSIMVAPLPRLETWLLIAPSLYRPRVEDEVCENLPDTSSRWGVQTPILSHTMSTRKPVPDNCGRNTVKWPLSPLPLLLVYIQCLARPRKLHYKDNHAIASRSASHRTGLREAVYTAEYSGCRSGDLGSGYLW